MHVSRAGASPPAPGPVMAQDSWQSDELVHWPLPYLLAARLKEGADVEGDYHNKAVRYVDAIARPPAMRN